MDPRPPAERLAALQSRHRITAIPSRHGLVCEVDGVRLNPIRGGFRHDVEEMIDLRRAALRPAAS